MTGCWRAFHLRFVAAAVVGLAGGGRGNVCAWLLSFCFAAIACMQCLCFSDVAAAVIFGFPSVPFGYKYFLIDALLLIGMLGCPTSYVVPTGASCRYDKVLAVCLHLFLCAS